MEAPVLHCRHWPELRAALSARPAWRCLEHLPPALASAVLAAPAAVARAIAVFAPALAARETLSLLVIGAESVDAVDAGRWYQAVPDLLGSRAALHVTLVGESLDASFASAAAALAPAVAAAVVRAPLADCLAAAAPGGIDIALLFQPGFQKYRAWLGEDGLGRLLGAGAVVCGSSNGPDEYEMERWVLGCHGYRAGARAADNPFALDLGEAAAPIRWGSALWRIEAAPGPGYPVDVAGLAALDTLNRMVMHSMTLVGQPAPPPGARVALTAADGRRKPVIHVFDGRFASPTSGALLQIGAGGELDEFARLSATELARYPADGGDLERALWAAQIKARHLLPTYRGDFDPAAGERLAAAMLARMRERAAALFR